MNFLKKMLSKSKSAAKASSSNNPQPQEEVAPREYIERVIATGEALKRAGVLDYGYSRPEVTALSYITRHDSSFTNRGSFGGVGGKVFSEQEAFSLLSTVSMEQSSKLTDYFTVHKRLNAFCDLLSEVRQFSDSASVNEISSSAAVVDKIKNFIEDTVKHNDLLMENINPVLLEDGSVVSEGFLRQIFSEKGGWAKNPFNNSLLEMASVDVVSMIMCEGMNGECNFIEKFDDNFIRREGISWDYVGIFLKNRGAFVNAVSSGAGRSR